MLVGKDVLKELTELLQQSYGEVYDELTNERKYQSTHQFMGLTDINKPDLEMKADALISICRSIKKIKPYKGK